MQNQGTFSGVCVIQKASHRSKKNCSPGIMEMSTSEKSIGEEIYQTTEEHPDPMDTEIEGQIPHWINGALLRVGPGKFEWGDTSYNHWFDGDAILNRFAIKDGKVTFSSRFLRTRSYLESEKKNRIALTQFGTNAPPDPCKNIFSRFFSYFSLPELTDNCNVNIVKMKGETYASTESPGYWKIDKESLETLEAVNFEKKISGPRSWLAHPHYDEDGSYYNISSAYVKNRYEIYKVPPKQNAEEADTEGVQLVSNFPCKNGVSYYHSFGMTENYFVFIESSLFFGNPLGLLVMRLMDWAFVDFFKYNPKIKSRLHLIERKSGKTAAIYSVEPFMCFHQVNAYETKTEVVFDMCGYKNGAIMKGLYLRELRKSIRNDLPPAELRRYRLPIENLHQGTVLEMDLEKRSDGLDYEMILSGFELPRIHYGYNGKEYSYAYGMSTSQEDAGLTSLHKVNVTNGEVKSWNEDKCYPSEPLFVPSPEAKGEDDGVILSAVIGVRGQRSFLLVLDARDMTEIARAYVPIKLVPLIHGEFL